MTSEIFAQPTLGPAPARTARDALAARLPVLAPRAVAWAEALAVVAFGYEDSPFEVDARTHKVGAPPAAS